MNEPAYLIVNADDYGYFSGVSRGILDGGKDGLITAAGVMANSLHFEEHVQWLKDAAYLDVGVHLNLTFGKPLTARMADIGGEFPGKYSIAIAVLTGRIPCEYILEEWRAQIRRCVDAGLELSFLNTHEHLHALPPLLTVLLQLAKEYNIPYIRRPDPEWYAWEGMARNALLQAMDFINRGRLPKETPKLLGMSKSGKLTLPYLKKRLASLDGGQVYELMCHPGYFDPGEMGDPRLGSYHNWQQELDLLRSGEARSLCDTLGIQVIRYADLHGIRTQ